MAPSVPQIVRNSFALIKGRMCSSIKDAYIFAQSTLGVGEGGISPVGPRSQPYSRLRLKMASLKSVSTHWMAQRGGHWCSSQG